MEYKLAILTHGPGNVQLNEAEGGQRQFKLRSLSLNGSAKTKKPDTGDPLHTQEPVTVASFRTWRGWRECVARDRCLTDSILPSRSYSSLFAAESPTIEESVCSDLQDMATKRFLLFRAESRSLLVGRRERKAGFSTPQNHPRLRMVLLRSK